MSTTLPSAASEMTVWRHDLNAHPQFGFELTRTAAFVADKLRSFGFDEVVERGGRVGVGGTLRRGSAGRAIALRIEELGDRPHRSRSPGLIHACGHDGHTAMLLGAAKLLAAEGGFDGTVRFLFQPAEEWGRGALAMLEDGLLERFPFDEVYGLRNWALGRCTSRWTARTTGPEPCTRRPTSRVASITC